MRSAVIVIDVQQALFNGATRPFEADEVIARINQLTNKARSEKIPVIVIQHEKANTVMAKGSEGWQLPETLNVEADDRVLAKGTPDAFLGTELQLCLQQLDVSHLYITGYASEFCVDTTVRSAAAHGYDVTLVADAHTTHDKPHASAAHIRAHENATLPNITSFGLKIAAVMTTELLSRSL